MPVISASTRATWPERAGKRSRLIPAPLWQHEHMHVIVDYRANQTKPELSGAPAIPTTSSAPRISARRGVIMNIWFARVLCRIRRCGDTRFTCQLCEFSPKLEWGVPLRVRLAAVAISGDKVVSTTRLARPASSPGEGPGSTNVRAPIPITVQTRREPRLPGALAIRTTGAATAKPIRRIVIAIAQYSASGTRGEMLNRLQRWVRDLPSDRWRRASTSSATQSRLALQR
jgi:hypothetical protein